MFFAIVGITYGAYALYALGSFSDAHREEFKRKDVQLAQNALVGGIRGMAFRLGRPLFWFVVLPVKSVSAAIGVALLFILPALLAK